MKFVNEVIAKLDADEIAAYTYNFWLNYPSLFSRKGEWFVSISYGIFFEHAKLNREGFDVPLTVFERWRLTNAYFRAKKKMWAKFEAKRKMLSYSRKDFR